MRVSVSVQSHNQSVKVMQFLPESHKSRAQKKHNGFSTKSTQLIYPFVQTLWIVFFELCETVRTTCFHSETKFTSFSHGTLYFWCLRAFFTLFAPRLNLCVCVSNEIRSENIVVILCEYTSAKKKLFKHSNVV